MTDVYTVYMGDRLGLCKALADGKATEAEIAAAIATAGRCGPGVRGEAWRHDQLHQISTRTATIAAIAAGS